MHSGNTCKREGNRTGEVAEKTMTENLPKLKSDSKAQIQEAQRTPSTTNTQNSTPWHIVFKIQKITDEEKNPERNQRKETPHLQRKKIRTLSDFSSEPLE